MPYDGWSWKNIQRHLGLYAFASKFVNNKKMLDIACGCGYGTYYFMRKGAKSAVGGDISAESIECAKNCYQHAGLSYQLFDAEKLPFPNDYFDLIVSFETIEHLKNPRAFLSDCKRVLKHTGVFVCSTPNKEIEPVNTDGKPVNKYHIREFNVKEFIDLVNEYFKNSETYGYIKITETGRLRNKIEQTFKHWILSIPYSEKLVNVIGLFLRDYRLVRLIDLKNADFEKILNKIYYPYKLDALSPTAKHTVVVSMCIKDTPINQNE